MEDSDSLLDNLSIESLDIDKRLENIIREHLIESEY